MQAPDYVGLYGRIRIAKSFCEPCEAYAFVVAGALQCCGRAVTVDPARYKRETQPEQVRRAPPMRARRAKLEEQCHRCFYCDRRFGEWIVWPTGRTVRLNVAWDHMVPFAYAQNNDATNFVAACQVCNRWKSDHCFQTVEEAQLFLHACWERRLNPVSVPVRQE